MMNFRNTLQIAKVAKSLLDNDIDKEYFKEIENSIREGDKPKIACCSDYSEQLTVLNEQLTILREYSTLTSTVILHRTTSGLVKLMEFLVEHGFVVDIVNSEQPISANRDSIKLCSMTSVIGLEFDNVFIVDLDEDVIPYPPGFVEDNKEYYISTERRLLYTCITKAKNKLFLFTSKRNKASQFLKEIDPNLFDDITPNNYFQGPYFGECSFPF